MAGIAKQIDISALPQWLEHAERLLTNMTFEPAMKACQIIVVSATTKNFQTGVGPNGQSWPPPKMRAGKPLYDTGVLMASVTASGAGHTGGTTDTTLTWGTNLEYAQIHQYGGTIVPVNAKALAVPLTSEAKRSGGPRRMGDLHMVWPNGKPSGTLRDSSGKAQFALVKSITIPARPFLGWNEDMADECGEIIGDYAEQQIAKK